MDLDVKLASFAVYIDCFLVVFWYLLCAIVIKVVKKAYFGQFLMKNAEF